MRLPPLTPWGAFKRLREEPDTTRRIARQWIVAGVGSVLFAAAMGTAHFAFGVPFTDSDTGQPATKGEMLTLVTIFWCGGFAFALGGILLRRWINGRT